MEKHLTIRNSTTEFLNFKTTAAGECQPLKAVVEIVISPSVTIVNY
ncbi:MAG: hypothetical protein ACI3ZI_07060 [Candidatus Cryptobacteroides sp.]